MGSLQGVALVAFGGEWLEALERFGIRVVEALIRLLMFFVRLLPPAISDPFENSFMQSALLAAVLIGVVCGVISCYVVLKRWALLGDAISHAVLPGVALAHLFGWPYFVGGLVTGALTSVGIGFLERNSRIKEDTAMGLMFTGAFALGIVIIRRVAGTTHLMHIMFGNILGVLMSDLLLTLVAGVLTLGFTLLFYKELHLYSFDPVQARVLGINTRAVHYGMMLLLTLTIVASLESVGIILVVAMLIYPGATASLLTNSLPKMMLIGAGVGVFATTCGLYTAYLFDTAPGGAMVLVAGAVFALAFLFAPLHGFIPRRLRQRGRLAGAFGADGETSV